MLVSVGEFLAQYDDFKTLTDEQIARELIAAEALAPLSRWGDRFFIDGNGIRRSLRPLIVQLIAAHKLYLKWFQSAAIAGVAVQAAQGKGSLMPNANTDRDAYWNSTIYGQEFLEHRKGLAVSGFVI